MLISRFYSLLVAAWLPTIGHTLHVINLSNAKWTVKNSEGNITVPGSWPSHVHLDLYAAKVIDDPYYGLNDINLRWIAWSNWTYTSPPFHNLDKLAKNTWLVFNGLDTFTIIKFCEKFVGTTNNQFRQYTFDVSHILQTCQTAPTLSINFGSAPIIAQQLSEKPGQEQFPSEVEITFEIPNRQYIRKEQSDFGWDWGPAYAPAGPWQDGYIVQADSSNDVYVLNTDIDIFRQGSINHLPPDQTKPWVVNASFDYLGELPKGASLTYEITDAKDSKSILASGKLAGITTSGNSITGSALVGANTPKLWWPNGLGEQNLYNITVQIVDSNSIPLTAVTRRTGFRTIILNRTNITEAQLQKGIAPGANWHFEVNGYEFYAKGSNFIPPDAFWPRVTKERLGGLFDAVVAGNQNMLRVWASGAYSPDIMYDIADEKGVLLWSEFEFGDALYPVDQPFLDNVAAEVVYNVRRVNHHPSLALWVGNNEIEAYMLPYAQYLDPADYGKYVAEYEKLFISLILPLVYENSHISYNPGSTTNGYYYVNLSTPVPMAERYYNVLPGHYYGDTDFYNYDTSISFNDSAYPVGRFANEFGFHSMPSLQTWEQVVPKQDLSFNSSVVVQRNHHYPAGSLNGNLSHSLMGMGEMTMAVERYYPIPQKSDVIANFSAWCHATQIFQADMYKSEIQFYRRGSGFPNRQLGSLYWQLEDIWQAPSWAGIEYDGRWKVLHYMSRDIYQPVIISPFWNYTTGELEVYVTSDLWETVYGTATLNWYSYNGMPIAHNAGTPPSTTFQVGAINTTRVYSSNIHQLSIPDLTDAILILSVEASGHRPNEPIGTLATRFTHENFFSPVWMNGAKLVDPGLKVTYDSSSQKFTVEATKGVSLYTWLDYPAGSVGYFDENNFVLLLGQKKEVGFTTQYSPSSTAWTKGVTVQSMWDQMQEDD